MREIKFRAWSNHYKKFESYSLDQIINGKVNLWFFVESPVIMQFTGLKDKNGKEIYEGDIVSGWRKGSNSDRVYTGEVIWQTEQAGYIIRCGKYLLEILSLAMEGGEDYILLSSFEVIGNIYETPELLKS